MSKPQKVKHGTTTMAAQRRIALVVILKNSTHFPLFFMRIFCSLAGRCVEAGQIGFSKPKYFAELLSNGHLLHDRA